MKIFGKLMLLVGGTILCLVIAFCIVGYFVITSAGNRSARETLATSSKVVQDNINTNLQNQKLLSSILSEDAAFAAALAAKDIEALLAMSKVLLNSPSVDLVTICDANAVVLARGHDSSRGDKLADTRLSAMIPLKEGRAIVGLEPGKVVPLTLASGTPIRHNGQTVGVVITGMNLSSGAFVTGIKNSLGVESTIFLKDIRMSTTVIRDGKPFVGTPLNNPDIYRQVMELGKTVVTRNIIGGEEYDTAYWPWADMSGKNAGMFFVGLSRSAIKAEQNRVILFFSLAGAGLGLLLLIAGGFAARAFARPVRAATIYAEAVAGGDFERQITVRSKDEIGVLCRALQTMVGNLKEKIAEAEGKSKEAEEQALKASEAMTEAQTAKEKAENGQKALLQAAGHVEEVVGRLSASAQELAAQVEQASQSAGRQREQVTVSATAMEEMTATVLAVARNAGTAAEASNRAQGKAREGEGVVSRSVEAINMVQQDTLNLKQNMQELGNQAESIGAVMTVISDIADQTNLLALNAAIEAARAGEAGRGFAVVADEVRKLAEKTMTATHEVGRAIDGIQQGAKKNIEAVESTTVNLASATEMVNKSGVSLAEIVQEAAHAADQVSSIAASAEEQSAASEEISHSLDGINAIAGETANVMERSAKAVNDLSEQAGELLNLVNALRTNKV